MKNKKTKKVIYVLSVLFLIIYMSGRINICLGSNTYYYNTPFDYAGAEWYCDKFELMAYTVENGGIKIESKTGEMDFYLKKLNHLYAEVCSSSDYNVENINYTSFITSYKKWWKIYRFSLDLPGKNSQVLIAHFKRVK